MKTLSLILFGGFFLFASPAIAQWEHPFEKELADSLAEVNSDHEKAAYYSLYTSKWEEQIKSMIHDMGGMSNIKLTKSQTAWENYRKLESEHIEHRYKNLSGTMYIRLAAMEKYNLIHARGKILYGYYSRMEN